MILDILENAHRYLALHKGFAKAFDFLLRPDLKELPVGKYEIDGDRVYAMVSKNTGRRKENALLETHENTLIYNWSWQEPMIWDGSPSHCVLDFFQP
jgi:YhcH/YjgK/YiaL family protein